MTTKPFLMIDVDGVLNVFGRHDPDLHTLHPTPSGYTVLLDRRHPAWLAELGESFELAWATMWEDRAVTDIAPLVGLPALPWARMHRYGARSIADVKIPGVEELADGRPLAWLDDDHDELSTTWARQRTADGIPTLVVPVDPRVGITRDHIDRLHAFAADVEAAQRADEQTTDHDTTTRSRTVTTPTLTDDDIARWWRRPGHVTDQIVISGDLPHERGPAQEHLARWIDAGVTAILDVRGEWSDEALVADVAPHLEYIHLGVDDNGTARDLAWFDAGVDAARQVLATPDARVIVHCHMGINRGPSMAFAILLDQGWDAVEALEAIRAVRPIAAVAYADDAIRWHHQRLGSTTAELVTDLRRVRRWHADNGIDVVRIIRRIRQVEHTGSLDEPAA